MSLEWGKVPWSLWAYVALTIGGIAAILLTASVPVAPSIFFVFFNLAWSYFLLRSVRWLWIATIVVGSLGLAVELATGTGTWHGILMVFVGLVLLLLPATRRFFGARESVPAVQQIPPEPRPPSRLGKSSIVVTCDRWLVGLGLYKPDTRPLVKLQSVLAAVAVVTVVLMVLNGAVEKWHHGRGGSLGVEILVWIVWIVCTLAKVVLLGVLVATIRQWYMTRRRTSVQP